MQREDIQKGMLVRGPSGEKLGRVVACDVGTFLIEKGRFLPTEHYAYYTQVADIQHGEVRLSDPVVHRALWPVRGSEPMVRGGDAAARRP